MEYFCLLHEHKKLRDSNWRAHCCNCNDFLLPSTDEPLKGPQHMQVGFVTEMNELGIGSLKNGMHLRFIIGNNKVF